MISMLYITCKLARVWQSDRGNATSYFAGGKVWSNEFEQMTESECLPDKMPEYMPDKMPEDRMSEYMSDRMPECMSDRMPDTMPEYTSD